MIPLEQSAVWSDDDSSEMKVTMGNKVCDKHDTFKKRHSRGVPLTLFYNGNNLKITSINGAAYQAVQFFFS